MIGRDHLIGQLPATTEGWTALALPVVWSVATAAALAHNKPWHAIAFFAVVVIQFGWTTTLVLAGLTRRDHYLLGLSAGASLALLRVAAPW